MENVQDNKLPSHLGGHKGRTHIDNGVLEYMIENYKIKTFLDIGCGPGGMVDLAVEKNLKAVGIDGDYTLARSKNNFIIHDYTKGPSELLQSFDMIWSCEFVEHVDEIYLENYMEDFKKGKFVVMTFSEKAGHHHVNLKPEKYWIEKFVNAGFKFDSTETEKIRQTSTMNLHTTKKKQFVRNSGLFFQNLK